MYGAAAGIGAVVAVVHGLGRGCVHFGVVVDVGVGLDDGAGHAVVEAARVDGEWRAVE